jgi:hypothetical protein
VARARGADHLVLYGREPFRDVVKRITDGRGADVVFDPVGGEIFENSLRCIAWGARILVVGFTGGIGLARTNLLMIKGASVLGVRAGEAVRKNPALGEARIKALSEWAEAGKIRPHICHRLRLEDYAQAMRLLTDRKAIGRVALMMRDVVPAERRDPYRVIYREGEVSSSSLDHPLSRVMATGGNASSRASRATACETCHPSETQCSARSPPRSAPTRDGMRRSRYDQPCRQAWYSPRTRVRHLASAATMSTISDRQIDFLR